jgi:hypothetical protein
VRTLPQRNVSNIRPRVNHDAIIDHETTSFLNGQSECVNVVRGSKEIAVKFDREERLIWRDRKRAQTERSTGCGVDAVMRCSEKR